MNDGCKSGDFVDRFRINAANGHDLLEYVSPLGIDLKEVAGCFGLSVEIFRDFRADVSLDRFCRLLEDLARRTGDDTFGLNYAKAYQLGSVGPISYAMRNAPDLNAALEFLTKYAGVTVDLDIIKMQTDPMGAAIVWTYSPEIVARAQYADFGAYQVLRLLRQCAGSDFATAEARFERPSPRSTALHRSMFGPNVSFGTEFNAVHFSAELLHVENASADAQLFELMKVQCDELLAARPVARDIVSLLKGDLLAHLESGDVSIGEVANRLGLSERSLQRRLSECGTGYQEQLEALCKDVSLRLLRQSALPLSEVARRLGYSSQSAFSRASIRWHGKPPGAVRAGK